MSKFFKLSRSYGQTESPFHFARSIRAIWVPFLAAGALALGVQGASAFGGTASYDDTITLGDQNECSVELHFDAAAERAYIRVRAGQGEWKYAGGASYAGGDRGVETSLTEADVQTCFSETISNFDTSLNLPNSFAAAEDLEFSFDIGAGFYAYSLFGQTDTQKDIRTPQTQQPAEGPTVQILDAPESHNGEEFLVRINFSEFVTDFDMNDIAVGNGQVTVLYFIDSDRYEASILPSGDGDVTIDIAAGVAESRIDGADNQAAARVVVRGSSNEATVRKIRSFVQNRATHVLNHQPSLSGFIDGSNLAGGGPLGNLGLSANADRMDLAFSSSLSRIQAARQAAEAGHDNGLAAIDQSVEAAHASSYAAPEAANRANAGLDNIDALDNSKDYGIPQNRFDVWTQLYASRAKLNQSRADTIVAYLGAHYFVNPNLIVGAMAQYDSVSEKNGSSSVDGTGWMAGPYIAGRLPGHSLLYEARIAWGQSNNKISPTGTYKDRFDTTRWIATGQIEGDILLSSLDQMTRVAFNPFLRATYFEEKQDSYVDSNGSRVEGQTYSVGEIRFGPKFTLVTELDNGVRLTPFVSASGLWDFKMSGNDSSQNSALKEGSLRARLDAGLGIKTANDWLFNMSSFHDGIGVDKYQAYGGKVRLTIPLN